MSRRPLRPCPGRRSCSRCVHIYMFIRILVLFICCICICEIDMQLCGLLFIIYMALHFKEYVILLHLSLLLTLSHISVLRPCNLIEPAQAPQGQVSMRAPDPDSVPGRLAWRRIEGQRLRSATEVRGQEWRLLLILLHVNLIDDSLPVWLSSYDVMMYI